jgi:hypothetical protein
MGAPTSPLLTAFAAALVVWSPFGGVVAESEHISTGAGCEPYSGIDLFPSDHRLVVGTTADQQTSETEVVFAEDFSVEYREYYKYVTNYNTGETLVLTQCGNEHPDASSFPDGTKFFTVPVSSVATASTVPLTFLELLGLRDNIEVLDATYVSSPCLQKLTECGSITHTSGSAAEWSDLAAGADVVITDAWGTGASGTEKDVAFDASSDPGLLQRAEWIKFLSLFFNAEAVANEVFADIATNFEDTKAEVAALNAVAQTVAFAQYNQAYPDWGIEESFTFSDAAYKLELVEAAGGANPDYATLGLTFATSAEMKEALKGIDVLIDETYWYSPPDYTDQMFLDTFGFTAAEANSGDWPFLTNSMVYRLDGVISDFDYDAYGHAFLEAGIPHPDILIGDLAAELYPDANIQGDGVGWMRDILAGEEPYQATAEDCEDPWALCPGEDPPETPSPPSDADPLEEEGEEEGDDSASPILAGLSFAFAIAAATLAI